jgi:uncharacterized protein (TIGR01777 family)
VTSLTVAVTGATGLIGTALTEHLTAGGHVVRRVVRRDPRPGDVLWDPAAGTIDAPALAGVDAVVHLAGAGIGDHRWTDDYRREILESRTRSTDLLSRTLAGLEQPPAVLLSGSAVGIYGASETEAFTEASPHGEGFLADVCVQWEAGTAPAEAAGIRVAHLRTGIVLSPKGGALKKLLPLFKAFVGGRFGSGRQWQSWISIDDEVAAIEHLLTTATSGPVNLTAPNPVTNRDFTTTLAKVLKRPAVVPVPRFGPATLLGGDLADALLYTGQQVLPTVLTASGYEFRHADLEGALRHLLDRPA